jgi:hypothetical protein
MEQDRIFEVNVPVGDGVPLHRRVEVEMHMRADQLERMKRAARARRALEGIRQAYVAGLRSRLGQSRYASYRAILSQVKAEKAEALHPPRGSKLSPEGFDALDERLRKRTLALLRKYRIDPATLKVLRRRARAEAARIAAPDRGKRSKELAFVLPRDVPREVRENEGNPWTIFTPPFQGSGSWYEWNPLGDFYKGTGDYTNKDTGQVGHYNRVSMYDASDIDMCHAHYRTSIGSWYKMPKTGLVEVWIEAQLGLGLHICDLDDEWGFSDSHVLQWSYLWLQTWGPPDSKERTALMSNFYEEGYTDEYWSTQFLTSGQTYWAHLFSDVSYAKDTWLYVDVGVYTHNYVYTNDVEAKSRIDFKWFFPRVYVDSTG